MTDRLHLGPRHRAMLERLFEEHLPGVEVWAYGSRVNGRSHDGSDLDLVLRGPGLDEVPFDQLEDFEEAVRVSALPFLVEARDWAHLPERFHREIERDYLVLVRVYSQEMSDGTRRGDEWCETTLEQITINFDSMRVPVKKADRQTGPHPYYGASGVVDYIDRYIFDGEYLLIAEDGENLRTRKTAVAFLARGKFWVNNHAHIIQGNNRANTCYLLYALSQMDFSGYLTGSTMPKLTQGNLNRIKMLTPPLSEQRAIAHILGTLDDKIELNRRMNEMLEGMAHAIFRDWFVDFGPVRAKMERREAYLSSEIWELFPDALDNEGKPEGWEFHTLARLAATNCSSWTAQHHPPEIEYLDLSSVKWGKIKAIQFLDWNVAPSRARRIAREGDTIVGTTRPGNGSFAYISKDGLTVSTGFSVLSPQKIEYRDFVYLSATRTENISRLANLADGHGGAYPAVKPSDVLETPIVFPGDRILKSFAELVFSFRERAECAKLESQTLSQIRDLLLPKLVSGEIRVRDAGRIVEAVA